MPDAAAIRQLTVYALAYQLQHHREPALAFVYLLKTKKPRLVRMPNQRSIAEQAWFVGLAREVAAAIHAGAFPPNPKGWRCAGCEYAGVFRPHERKSR